jgi:hypothetical protein
MIVQPICSLILQTGDTVNKANMGADRMDWMEKVSMGMDKPLPPELPDPEMYTVEFEDAGDPQHPYNWKRSSKYV